MASDIEIAAMRRALALAATVGRTHPNPRVGAVVLDASGDVVGHGFHRGPGSAHAEVVALQQAGTAAQGSTAVVTLEPCNHTGRTRPCAQALLDAGVRRVVYGQRDPNPVASGGAAMLAASGLSVEGLVLADEAEQLNVIWTRAMQLQRPFVTWKVASTVDGRVAAPDGSSRWVSGPAARAEVHELRAKVDAVVVGTGTVWADDPELTARDHDGVPHVRQPLRVVIGKRDLPGHSRVLDESFETVHLRTHDLDTALKALFERDVHHVLLEGGPTLAAAVLAAGLVDQAIGYIAPALFGGGTSMVASLPVHSIDDAVRFEFDDVRLVGGDLRWSASSGSFVTDGLRE